MDKLTTFFQVMVSALIIAIPAVLVGYIVYQLSTAFWGWIQ